VSLASEVKSSALASKVKSLASEVLALTLGQILTLQLDIIIAILALVKTPAAEDQTTCTVFCTYIM
jgi:hypothetical protein